VRDPLEDWIRKDAGLAGTFSVQQPGSVSRLRPMNTRCVSWATPIAASCDRPVTAAAAR
jgi:hypothetical protein